MKILITLILFFYVIISISCIFSGEESKVTSFHYGGYSDTVFALLGGNVYERQHDKLIPLAGVKVFAESNGKTVYTDSLGYFLIGLEKGAFSFLVTKENFEPLRVTNFTSDPDQVSSIKIELEKGSIPRTDKLPERVGN